MDADHIPAAAIRAQLAKILRSAEFAVRRSTGRLLRFFVEETLRHGPGPITQRQIATHALGLQDGFNPSKTAHVRVVVRRLRNALGSYYASTGQDDPVIFRLTPGPYRLIAELSPGRGAAEPLYQFAGMEPAARRSLPTILLMEPAVAGEADDVGRLCRDVAALVASALVGSPFMTAAGPLLRASLAAGLAPPLFAATLGFDYVVDSSIRRLDDGRCRLTIDVAGTDGGGSILARQAEIGPCADGRTLADEIAVWLCHRIGDAALADHADSGRGPRSCGIAEEGSTVP